MKWQKKRLQRAPQKHQLYHGLIEVKLTYLFIIILKLMREFLTNYKIRKSYPFPQLSCTSSEKKIIQGLNELITYECLGHNWLWAEEFQDVRVSMLSCYSPGTLDTLDSKRSTAWKKVGGAKTKRRLKDFSSNCNTAALKEQLPPIIHIFWRYSHSQTTEKPHGMKSISVNNLNF